MVQGTYLALNIGYWVLRAMSICHWLLSTYMVLGTYNLLGPYLVLGTKYWAHIYGTGYKGTYLVLDTKYWAQCGAGYWAMALSIQYCKHTWYWEGREGVKRPGPGEGVSPVSWMTIIMVNIK